MNPRKKRRHLTYLTVSALTALLSICISVSRSLSPVVISSAEEPFAPPPPPPPAPVASSPAAMPAALPPRMPVFASVTAKRAEAEEEEDMEFVLDLFGGGMSSQSFSRCLFLLILHG